MSVYPFVTSPTLQPPCCNMLPQEPCLNKDLVAPLFKRFEPVCSAGFTGVGVLLLVEPAAPLRPPLPNSLGPPCRRKDNAYEGTGTQISPSSDCRCFAEIQKRPAAESLRHCKKNEASGRARMKPRQEDNTSNCFASVMNSHLDYESTTFPIPSLKSRNGHFKNMPNDPGQMQVTPSSQITFPNLPLSFPPRHS